ncbi:MAG: phosphonate metabolism protein/1,5-bisphosphokinase (PRPP-forming) PhnN [Microbacteriaceae bacterium]|nr:phosphonate metabolism protein/1,5-bisphosphokinase (PRPP-forming) PhnN [Microbacteriaceae bacterium]
MNALATSQAVAGVVPDAGAFVAVVGASGAGKDAVMQWAATALADESAVRFIRRAVTRPAGPGEDHLPHTEAEFDAALAAGAFAAHWPANGLRYGIPLDVDELIAAGTTVVANCSRTALPALAARFPGLLRVVRVSVSPETRAARLALRGRENAVEQAVRLARTDPAPGFPVDLELGNDGPIAEAGEALAVFLSALRAARSA